MQNKAKILIVGPTECGKTYLSNFLSDAGDIATREYRPTKGCRIVEFDVPNVQVNGNQTNAEVELWDVSGDRSYANCWPVIQRGTNGIIFVYNRGNDDHPRYLEFLHAQFAGQLGLKDNQSIVLCHNKPDSDGYPAKLSNVFSGIAQIESDLSEEGSGRIRQDFTKYLGHVLSHMSDMAEKHENSILQ